MTSKERVKMSVSHKQPDQIPMDFDGTTVTGMHASCVEALRDYYGLEKRSVKIHDPSQCLGLIEEDLAKAIGTDVVHVAESYNFFGVENKNWKQWKTPWGQEVLVAGDFTITTSETGDIYTYPQGDTTVSASGHLPAGGYFFDAIIRQHPLPLEDSNLNVEDNLEEFEIISEEGLDFIEKTVNEKYQSEKYVIGSFGGAALGDIAKVPGAQLKDPKGIRDIQEWYISTAIRQGFIGELFEKQYDIAIENLKKIHNRCGQKVDALFLCGTDFGTQNSTFCSPETFKTLWMPHYKRINEWIHNKTNWKVFKHSCGAIHDFIPLFIESGFDILNPVQCSAAGMEPERLKQEFGKDITFWGGGVDTQKTLPFGTPKQVREEVLRRCEIFSKHGGFVFNAIHNVQAKTPTENIIAMIDAVHEFNGR
jgi:hypothetical protein